MAKRRIHNEKTVKLLRELPVHRAALAVYEETADATELTPERRTALEKRITKTRRIVTAVDHAMTLLSPTETEIITGLYFENGLTAEDLCERCAMERSSIYRYRASALEKLESALYAIL